MFVWARLGDCYKLTEYKEQRIYYKSVTSKF